MAWAVMIARVLLGLTFTFFGFNSFLWAVTGWAMLEPPKEMPEAAAAFYGALKASGYMLPLVAAVQLVSGLMILTGIYLPLGLVLLAPVLVNIVLYHHFVDTNGLALAYVLAGLELFLAYAYAEAFKGLLAPGALSRWARIPR